MTNGRTSLCLVFSPAAQAKTLPEEVKTKGDFALWLVKEAGAIRQLPPAGNAEDAIAFLQKIGIVFSVLIKLFLYRMTP